MYKPKLGEHQALRTVILKISLSSGTILQIKRRGRLYTKLFATLEITRNNTLNKVRIAMS